MAQGSDPGSAAVDDLEGAHQGESFINDESVIDLFEAVGPWGNQQKSFVFKVMCTVAFCAGMHMMLPMFLTLEPPRFPKCDETDLSSLCDPKKPLDFSDCSSAYSYWYDGASIVTEFDLTPTYCDKNPFKTSSWTTMIFAVGYVVGSWFLGSLGDALGRRSSLLLGISITTIAAFFASITATVAMFSVARFVVGMGVGGSSVAAFVLACELVGSAHRPLVTILFSVHVCLGGAFTAGLGAVNPNWRWLSMLTCAVGVLQFAAFASRSNVESPRWQAATQQEVKAFKTFKKISRINKKSLPPSVSPLNIMYHLVNRQSASDMEKQARMQYRATIDETGNEVKPIELSDNDSSDDGLDDDELFYKGPPTGDGFFKTFNTWPFHIWIWALVLMWFSVSLLYFSCVLDIAAVREFELAAKSWLGMERLLLTSPETSLNVPAWDVVQGAEERLLYASREDSLVDEVKKASYERPKFKFDSKMLSAFEKGSSQNKGNVSGVSNSYSDHSMTNRFKPYNEIQSADNSLTLDPILNLDSAASLSNDDFVFDNDIPKNGRDGSSYKDSQRLRTSKVYNNAANKAEEGTHSTLLVVGSELEQSHHDSESKPLVENEIKDAINNGTRADSSVWANIWSRIKREGVPGGKQMLDRMKDILERQNATQRAQEFAYRVKDDIVAEFDFNQPLADYYKNLRRIGFTTMALSLMQGLSCAILIGLATCKCSRRKASLMMYSITASIICFAAFAIRIPSLSLDSKSRIVASVAVTTVAKIFSAGCLALLNLYTFDLFPTTIRSTMVGFITTSGFMAAIVAPFAYPFMNSVVTGFLLLVAACLVLFSAGCAARLLPESHGWKCFETMDMLHEFAIQDASISNNLSMCPLCCYEICFRVCCCKRRKRRPGSSSKLAASVKSAMAKGADQVQSAKRKIELALGQKIERSDSLIDYMYDSTYPTRGSSNHGVCDEAVQ